MLSERELMELLKPDKPSAIPYHPIPPFVRQEDDEERARRLKREREWRGADNLCYKLSVGLCF